jgi:hypothetical protein
LTLYLVESRQNVILLDLFFVEIKPDDKCRLRFVVFSRLFLNYALELFVGMRVLPTALLDRIQRFKSSPNSRFILIL